MKEEIPRCTKCGKLLGSYVDLDMESSISPESGIEWHKLGCPNCKAFIKIKEIVFY